VRFLVSGASGFVGSNLVPVLEQKGHRVETLDRSRSTRRDAYTWDEEAWNASRADVWIHLAGMAHDVKARSLTEAYSQVNTGLTERFFSAFRGSTSGSLLLYVSSVKAAASVVEGRLREDDRQELTDPYGMSKRAAEDAMLAADLDDKRLVILRPCMIHGPGNRGNLNLLYRMVRRGVPYPLAAFDNRRSLLSIDNFCAVVETIARTSIDNGVYNLADDEPLSTVEIVRMIAEVEGTTTRIWRMPPDLIRWIARLGDLIHLPLTTARLRKLTESYVVSNDKVKRALGWQRLPVSARDGLIKTIRSFSKQAAAPRAGVRTTPPAMSPPS